MIGECYQYEFLHLANTDMDTILNRLNKLGDKGWRVLEVNWGRSGARFDFEALLERVVYEDD